MLYLETLRKLEPEINKIVDDFFMKIEKNQYHQGDLLLVAVHGFYDKNLTKSKFAGVKLSPYVFGSGEEGLTNSTQHAFFEAFLRGYMIGGSRDKYIQYINSDIDAQKSYLITTQLELLTYLKFWESDYFLKQFYNLTTRLLHGKPYDWHVSIRDKGKKNLLDIEIKCALRTKAPKFLGLFEQIYFRQIRNAAAHSQFWLNNSHLVLMNYDPSDGHVLKSLTIDEWENIFHRFFLFARAFNNRIREFEKRCMEEAADKHFGKPVMLSHLDNSARIEFLKCIPEVPRWVWYKSWAKHNLKIFTII